MVKSVVLFPPFYFVFYISNLLSYIKNISSNELARPVMGTIFLVLCHPPEISIEHPGVGLASLAQLISTYNANRVMSNI